MTRLSKITPEDIEEHNIYRETPVFYSEKSKPVRDSFDKLCLKTPLEPYSKDLYKFFATSYLKKEEGKVLEHDMKKIQHELSVCHVLVEILRDLRAGKLRWGKEVVSDVWVSDSVMVEVQARLLEYLEEIEHTSGFGEFSEPIMVEAIRIRWSETLAYLPDIDEIDYEENWFTDESFEDVAERVEKCYNVSNKLFELSEEYLVREFIKTVKALPVKQNNALYRAVYDCLVFFGWIPQKVQESHKCYADNKKSRYVKENYIKSKFRNLKDENPDWEALISAAIDPDLYDPHK